MTFTSHVSPDRITCSKVFSPFIFTVNAQHANLNLLLQIKQKSFQVGTVHLLWNEETMLKLHVLKRLLDTLGLLDTEQTSQGVGVIGSDLLWLFHCGTWLDRFLGIMSFGLCMLS
jgi:hypothetical protein